jgi:1,2-diacylglycerol 3-alpha-glucosyltransferase
VIPRSVDPTVFDRPAGADPFPAGAKPGARLLCVCRQTREKGISRLIRIFARHIAPALPDATLTLVGDGPDFDAFVDEAKKLRIDHRIFFLGEQPLTEVPRFYRHADLFVFTSLSETYGQVVSEAMWCGLPVVALDDGMGVSQQIESGVDGVLVSPGPDESQANWRFAKEVFTLLRDPARRRAVADEAERRVRLRADPERCVERYFDAFSEAREHCRATEGQRRSSPHRAHLTLARWTWVHTLLVSMGLLRPPATINRNKARPPAWDGASGVSSAARSRLPSGRTRGRNSDVTALASAIEELVADEATNGGLSAAKLRKFAASYRLVASS